MITAWSFQPSRESYCGGERATDILARVVGQKLTEAWGQPVVIDNRGGAGDTVGAAEAAKATPDGHTLVMGAIHHTISSSVYRSCPQLAGVNILHVPYKGSAPAIAELVGGQIQYSARTAPLRVQSPIRMRDIGKCCKSCRFE